MLQRLIHHIDDILYVLGGGLLTYGIWQTFAPAGYMAGGILLMSLGLFVARRRAYEQSKGR